MRCLWLRDLPTYSDPYLSSREWLPTYLLVLSRVNHVGRRCLWLQRWPRCRWRVRGSSSACGCCRTLASRATTSPSTKRALQRGARNGDALLCSLAGQVCTPAGRRRSSGGRGGHGEGQRALRSRGASMFGEVSGVSLFYTPTFFGRTEHLRCFPHVSGATYVPRGVGGSTCGQGRRGLYSPACTVRARTAQTTSGLPTY